MLFFDCRTCEPYPEEYCHSALESSLEKGPAGKCLEARPLSRWSGQAKPKNEILVRPHVGPPPIGGTKEVPCHVDWVLVKGRALAIQSLVAEAGYWIYGTLPLGLERNLSLCESLRNTG